MMTRRLRGNQIFVFLFLDKILNGYENIDSRTRGHEVALVRDRCRFDIR